MFLEMFLMACNCMLDFLLVFLVLYGGNHNLIPFYFKDFNERTRVNQSDRYTEADLARSKASLDDEASRRIRTYSGDLVDIGNIRNEKNIDWINRSDPMNQ